MSECLLYKTNFPQLIEQLQLIHKVDTFFKEHFSPRKWHGFRLLAVDGSTIKAPRTEEVINYFGAWNPAKGERCPIARASQMFAVKQDFYARVFMLNLTSILAFPLQDQIDANCKECIYSYQINWTQALAKMKNVGILLFIHETVTSMIEKLLSLFLCSVVPIRMGRQFPRKPQFNQRRFAFAYKKPLS